MTLSTTINKEIFVGDGAIKIFAVTYRVISATHIEVYLAGVLQVSGFTVVLNSNQDTTPGATVTFTAAPGIDVSVTILRVVPLTQLTDYQPFDAFPAESHETALDKLTMSIQQQQEQIGRSPQLPVDSPLTEFNLGVPAAEEVVQYNAAEDGFESSGINATAFNANVAQTAADAVSTAADATTSNLNVGYSEEWANKAVDVLVSVAAGGDGTTEYSARHWANKVGPGTGQFGDVPIVAKTATIANITDLKYGPLTPIGAAFTLPSQFISVTAINEIDLAIHDSSLDHLRVYRWSGSAWSLLGASFATAGSGSTQMGLLNRKSTGEHHSADILLNDTTLDVMRAFQWNDITLTWSQLTTQATSAPIFGMQIAHLTTNTVAIFSRDWGGHLRTYFWDGVSFAQVGNSYTGWAGNDVPDLAALNETDIAVFFSKDIPSIDGVQTIRWDGTDWTLVGNRSRFINQEGGGIINSFNGREVLHSTQEFPARDAFSDIYRFDGSDWSRASAVTHIVNDGIPQQQIGMGGSNVAIIDQAGTLQMYTCQLGFGHAHGLQDDPY